METRRGEEEGDGDAEIFGHAEGQDAAQISAEGVSGTQEKWKIEKKKGGEEEEKARNKLESKGKQKGEELLRKARGDPLQ